MHSCSMYIIKFKLKLHEFSKFYKIWWHFELDVMDHQFGTHPGRNFEANCIAAWKCYESDLGPLKKFRFSVITSNNGSVKNI